MRWTTWLVSAAVAFGAASCGENTPPQGQSQTHLSSTANHSSPSQGSQTARAKDATPTPPANAMWTIFCDSVDGPAHVADASLLKSRLLQISGLKSWYVIHGEKESSIYYGYYGSLNDPKEKARAEQDRAKIASLNDNLGNRLVRGDLLVAINPPDPQAPADWNLLNTPKDRYWTIEIATFVGNPKRKEAAVDMVRDLRSRGETEAYFYQGPTASSVCIGAWPRDAVAEQGTGLNRHGEMRDDAHTQSPDQPLLVFVGDAAPANIPGRVFEPGTGKAMAVEGMKLQVLDADMKAKMTKEEYKYHSINYELHAKQANGQMFYDPAVLTIIPHDAAVTAVSDNDWQLTGGNAAPKPQPPSTPGDNVLRSIGDK
ncbi:MAG TPA: hypothetical protein VN541_23345 [Tepidisphaeraceae bacterium]|nr:hypothetical protein [Tepidisphaeraceae bacterium]